MKKIVILSLALFSTVAFASGQATGKTKTSTSGIANANAEAVSGSQSAANNTGNTQSIIFTSPPQTTQEINSTASVRSDGRQEVHYSGSQTVKNVPSVSGPPLVTSNDTCMGSASGSVNGPGFGVSLGKTYTDENCVMLKNSREMWNMGMRAAAMARMCMDDKNREALELTGFTCPQKQVKTDEPTDPYVRERMGLAPLSKPVGQ